MLQGHVDSISHERIEGWAADDAAPEQRVDVSILVNARLVARIACDLPREDLGRTGQYSDGRHGFVYEFPKPLPSAAETRVTVVFSEAGAPLARGDRMVSSQGVTVLPKAAPVPEEEPVMMPAPRDPRALFELLYLYEERAGLYPLISRLDMTGQRPQDVHYSVLGAWPNRAEPAPPGRYYPRDHLNELLLGDAFQTGLVPRLAEAYADKRRLIFVHIPKCAGTDLSNKLKTRFPWVDQNIMDQAWTTKDAMLRHLSRLTMHLRFADSLYLCGHSGLDFYLDRHLIRPQDQVFTIVRNPVAIILSQVNYVLTRFQIDATAGATGPDTAGWLARIGYDALPETMSEGFVRETAALIVRHPDVVRPNPLCFWLGGEEANTETALLALRNSDIEITDMRRYTDWLARRWNIVSDTRDNASVPFLTLETLPREMRDYMREISREDTKLYEMIQATLAATDRTSVFGHELR